MNTRYETLNDCIAWLREQKGVIPDYKQGALMIVRSSLRLQGALDTVARFPGVRVRRNVPGGRNREATIIEGLGGIL